MTSFSLPSHPLVTTLHHWFSRLLPTHRAPASPYEALLGIVDGHRGEAQQPVESSETYVIVYTTRGEQLEPVVTINDPAQFKREKGAASFVPLRLPLSQHVALTC